MRAATITSDLSRLSFNAAGRARAYNEVGVNSTAGASRIRSESLISGLLEVDFRRGHALSLAIKISPVEFIADCYARRYCRRSRRGWLHAGSPLESSIGFRRALPAFMISSDSCDDTGCRRQVGAGRSRLRFRHYAGRVSLPVRWIVDYATHEMRLVSLVSPRLMPRCAHYIAEKLPSTLFD